MVRVTSSVVLQRWRRLRTALGLWLWSPQRRARRLRWHPAWAPLPSSPWPPKPALPWPLLSAPGVPAPRIGSGSIGLAGLAAPPTGEATAPPRQNPSPWAPEYQRRMTLQTQLGVFFRRNYKGKKKGGAGAAATVGQQLLAQWKVIGYLRQL